MPNCWSYPKILGADLSTLMGIINKASPNWKPGPEGGPRTWTSQSMGETKDLRPPHSDPVLGQSLSVPLATAACAASAKTETHSSRGRKETFLNSNILCVKVLGPGVVSKVGKINGRSPDTTRIAVHSLC